ncbi:DNA/RNA non-specific endonuclease [Neorhizobium sp. NPDC001467]|uniref:DNA/RNA non-specific endonuclease n=1 Tax=Neorhizobium sp. NPDC001467 TaxID=3390595 RepID=UPI003CFF9965
MSSLSLTAQAMSSRAVKRLQPQAIPRMRGNPRLGLALGYVDMQGAGLFSRGHMTRREDPSWGSPSVARQADADTFHITNAAPQRQGFNGGIWLDLSAYVAHDVMRGAGNTLGVRLTSVSDAFLRS